MGIFTLKKLLSHHPQVFHQYVGDKAEFFSLVSFVFADINPFTSLSPINCSSAARSHHILYRAIWTEFQSDILSWLRSMNNFTFIKNGLLPLLKYALFCFQVFFFAQAILGFASQSWIECLIRTQNDYERLFRGRIRARG